MSEPTRGSIHDLPELRDRTHVFRDRAHAGEVLAAMLDPFRESVAIVLAIPAGGVPVAVEIARGLNLTLEVAPVSKILLPWTTEAGYGAVAFDGSVWIDADAVASFRLTEDDVTRATRNAREKVERRVQRLRGDRPLELRDRPVIVVDDGIAAGSTMRAAIAALRRLRAPQIVIAVPTAHSRALRDIAVEVDAIHCANVRHGLQFAVAEAYQRWTDVSDDEVAALLARATGV